MSLHRPLVSAFIWMLMFVVCSTATAQHGTHRSIFGAVDDDHLNAALDPYEIDVDWFEPIYDGIPDERPLNSGWFFSYDRVNLNVTRPRDEPRQLIFDPETLDTNILESQFRGAPSADYEGDWAWGNRFDFGYISPEGTGLWIVARKLDDPNRIEEEDNIDFNADNQLRPDGEPWGPTFVTLNGFAMWGVEANRTWRLPATPKGTILEPFIGARYAKLRDYSDRTDVYTDIVTDSFPLTGVAGELQVDRLDFNYQQNRVTTDNDLFGGQFGVRSRWRRGRWQIVSDVRGMLFHNYRSRERAAINEIQQQQFTANYVPDGLGGGVLGNIVATGPLLQYESEFNEYDSSNHFVYGGEANIDATFEVTQGFALRAGLQIIAFADGVGRGFFATDDSVVLAGYTFGFSLNR